nr:AMP-binding protein [Arthrobacter alpinus]
MILTFVETFFACGLLGAIFVPLNTRLAAPELQFQLQDSGTRYLINAAALEHLAAAAAADTSVEGRLLAEPRRAPGDLAQELPDGVERYGEVVRAASAVPIDESVNHEDGAMTLYTSGTTGRPRGALLTHGNITWNGINTVIDMDTSRNDVALLIAPLFHVAALGMGLLPIILKGGAAVLESSFDPGAGLGLD